MSTTFYWHDYETFGVDPSKDRPSQFAGLRTDENLNVIGKPLVIYCQPQKDILPAPQACLITGITPQHAQEHGLPEPQFIEAIHQQLALPGTCGVGYNSIRFDDEVSRYTLYRNFYDPYQREWKNGNSRWDIIDMMRLTRALRPEGIEWPDHEPGRPSFKLEHLTAANGIEHAAAHDALSDVTATIAMAKLVKQKQPRLFDYVVNNRGKKAIAEMLNLQDRKPFFHISGMLDRAHMYGAVMMPLAKHPTNNNGIICFDLSADPEALISLDAEQIQHLVFTAAADLPEGTERIPLKVVHINKAPVVTTHKLIDEKAAARLDINMQRCEANWQRLNEVSLQTKLQQVFAERDFPAKAEAEQQLYQGFLPNSDKGLLDEVRRASAADFSAHSFHFADKRYNQMLFSYRARYFAESLSADEQKTWQESCQWRLTDETSGYLTLQQQAAEIEALLADSSLTEDKRAILEALKAWAVTVTEEFSLE
ncbi:MAG: exodeoxyribonuclease I [Porticoccaceae bacterium]|nr:exodeoxyribonuclease I [Porticoccaceae bacterium]